MGQPMETKTTGSGFGGCTVHALRIVACVLLAGGIPLSVSAQTTVTFASGPSWSVLDAANTPVGTAQNVCLNATNPSPCPVGATQWGYGAPGWAQSLAAVPGATWIWAPGFTGASTPASLAQYTFTNTLTLGGTPLSGTIFMLADDYVELRVNGTLVGTVGSITSPGLSGAGLPNLVQFNVLANLVAGVNTVSFTAQNGPDSFSGVPNANYSQNPAGVVFGGTLTSAAPVPTLSSWAMLVMSLLLALTVARRLRPAA